MIWFDIYIVNRTIIVDSLGNDNICSPCSTIYGAISERLLYPLESIEIVINSVNLNDIQMSNATKCFGNDLIIDLPNTVQTIFTFNINTVNAISDWYPNICQTDYNTAWIQSVNNILDNTLKNQAIIVINNLIVNDITIQNQLISLPVGTLICNVCVNIYTN